MQNIKIMQPRRGQRMRAQYSWNHMKEMTEMLVGGNLGGDDAHY